MLLKLILFLTEDFIKMIDTIILKRSDVIGKVPLTSDLVYGEVALNYKDGKLYYKNANETVVSLNTAELASKAPINNPTFTGTVSGITKAHIGLSAVDNTSDATKPISALTQAALDTKVNSLNAYFTGTPTGITKAHIGLSAVDNTSDALKPISIATQAALDAKVSANQGQGLSDANFTAVEKSKLAGITGVNTGDQIINLTGEVIGSGLGEFATTLSNTAVISKTLTSFSSAVGTVGTGDTIVSAISKLDGNITAAVNNYNTTTTLNQLKGPQNIPNKISEDYIPDILNVAGWFLPDASSLILPANTLGVDSSKNLYVHDGVITGGIPVKGRLLQGVTNVSAASTTLNTSVTLSRAVIDVSEVVSGLSLAVKGDISISGLASLTALAPNTQTVTLGIRILNGSSTVISRYTFPPGLTYDMSSYTFNSICKFDVTGGVISTTFANATYSALNYVNSTGVTTTDMPTVTRLAQAAANENGLIIELYLTYRYIGVAGSNITVASDLKILRS